MNVEVQIEQYIASQPIAKGEELLVLHHLVQDTSPGSRLWFSDGKNEVGKVVSNPNIGYGAYTINYADGSTKEFFRIGISANTVGISVYIMGLADKKFLSQTYEKTIGKASVTSYCIKFKSIHEIDLQVLQQAIKHGFDSKD